MRTEWDEDDHLLDEMLEDDVANDVDGWDEELTGLSSDEDAMPAGASLDRISNDDAATSVDPAAAVNQCVPIAATESRSEQEENAWDFESDLVLDEDNNESSAASSVVAAAAVTKTTEPAASEHCALAESMEGKDEMNNNQVLHKLEDNQKQVNAMTQHTRFHQASTEATRFVDTNVAADRHLTSSNSDINGNHHFQTNHQNGERHSNNDQNEWDFEDDIFNDENNALPDNFSSEVASAFENKGQENKADKPPPPTPPSVQKTNVIGDEPPPPPPPSSHLLRGKPLVQTTSQELNITNPFLSQDNSATSRGHNGNNMQDQDGDGWSDDEAFFNDDDMENLPVVPSKALSKSHPLPPLTAHHHQQQRQEAELPFNDPTQIKIHQMILTYLSNISNPQFLPRLNSKLVSPNNTAAINLREYYANRPGLKKYTLGVELDRMDYTIFLPGDKCLDDKDVIRSYFGVGPDGSSSGHEPEHTTPSLEEILIRSANQSLLADALVALTGSEEVLLDSSDEFHNHGDVGMSLILSGPTLSMTSVAESCDFVVDLEKGAVEATCVLAIVVPFHHGDSNEVDQRIVDKGQLVLARTRVSVRFRPGNEDMNGNDESTAQYVVHTVEPSFFCPDESTLLRRAAISLALDQNDPFFQGEDEMLHRQQEEGTTDVRDLFLLNHHLLSDSHLLAVSDHLVRLRGAAEASSTGFRSALRQLDGVTNVSGKLSLIKNATGGGGGGIGGFLALPSAQEIEAAEREAADTVVFTNAGPDGRFPGPPNNQHHREVQSHGLRPPPPPPPPPIPPKTSGQAGQDGSRPRPLIGGIFLSGLSRLAAAATQPDSDHRNLQWPEGGGTGLTPPSSPPRDTYSSQAKNQPHALDRGDEHTNSTYSIPQWDGRTGGTGLTPSTVHTSHNKSTLISSRTHSNAHPFFSHSSKLKDETKVVCPIHEKESMEDGDEKDGGWSDDGLDFDDEDQDNDKLDHEDPWEDSLEIQENAQSVHVVNYSSSASDSNHLSPFDAPTLNNDHMFRSLHSTTKRHGTEASLKFPEASLKPPRQPRQIANQRPESTASFEEEFVIVLKEKIEEEEREMRETGRMKRWRPISEDPIRRQRLMEVMVNQLDGQY